jgi:hypothetical protein
MTLGEQESLTSATGWAERLRLSSGSRVIAGCARARRLSDSVRPQHEAGPKLPPHPHANSLRGEAIP